MHGARHGIVPAAVVVLLLSSSGRGDLLMGRIRGGAGIWLGDRRGWRELASGDEVARARPIRVSAGGSAELLFGRSRLVLGPAARATLRAVEGRVRSVALERGTLRAVVARADGLLAVETVFGRLELTEGEAIVRADRAEATLRVVRGRGGVSRRIGGRVQTRSLEPGRSIRLTQDGVGPSGAGGALASVSVPATEDERPLGKLVLRDSLGRETDPLEIRKLRVRVRVFGAVALTEIEQTFFNPTSRRAEGVFYFPVPAGASLSRFAMYVDGHLVEGELVERLRARAVYEEIVRSLQDPALMEWQEGNVFKTRIFPIPPRGPKRILISYTQLLRASGGQRRFIYPLVSKTTGTSGIGRFELDAEVFGLDPERAVRVPAYPGARITRDGGTARVRLLRDEFRPSRDFVLRFTPARRGPLELVTDRRRGEDGFFMLSYLPSPGECRTQPAARRSSARGGGAEAHAGRDVVLMVDTSLSRRTDDYRAELRAARTLLSELGSDDRFAVLSFDVEPRLLHSRFVAGPGEVEAAMSALEEIVPLGATDIEAAFVALDSFLRRNESRGRPDVILLGDGIATLGETAAEKLLAKARAILDRRRARFHAVAMGQRYDRLVLAELSRRTGGLFRVMGPGDDVERDAFRFALALDSALLPAPEVEFSGVEVREVYPARPGTLVAGEEMIVLGRYASAGMLTVRVTPEHRDALRATFKLPETDSRNVFVPRLWARERLDALMLRPQTTEAVKEITDLSQEFTLITPYTSFLVLENEEAYRKYGIDRRKRRRYWEETGKLRTAPPPEELQRPSGRPRRPQPAPRPRPEPARPAPPEAPTKKPRPFTIADLDLSFLTPSPVEARVIATALSMLCLETYYRYLPLYKGGRSWSSGVGGGSSGARGRVAVGGGGGVPPARAPTRTTRSNAPPSPPPAPPQRRRVVRIESPKGPLPVRPPRRVFDREREIDMPENIEHPVFVHEEVEVRDRMETENNMDAFTARGQEDAISDIPLGGTGVVGNLGVGGGGAGAYGFRTGGGRRRATLRGGGSRASERIVDTTHGWLAKNQRPNGSWGEGGYEETGLALLAFLGAGHTEKTGRYKGCVQKAVAWLVGKQNQLGQIGGATYDHAICTLALAEAYGMARVQRTGKAAQRAVDRLISLQQSYSGWGEREGTSHPLVTIWSVMALKSAMVAGLKVDGRGFQGAISYLDKITAPDGAVGPAGRPREGEVHLLHTAGAMLARQFMGWRRHDPLITGAADVLVDLAVGAPEMPPDGLYLRYFGTLAIFQMGGNWWRKWNAWSRDSLISSIRTDGPDACSWDPRGVWIRGRRPIAAVEVSAAEAGRGIEAALARVRQVSPAAAGCREAYQALAAALSQTTDTAVLRGAFAEAKSAPADASALVLMRLGIVRLQRGLHEEAVKDFRSAYELAGGRVAAYSAEAAPARRRQSGYGASATAKAGSGSVNTVTRRGPDNIMAWYVLALRKAGRARDALSLLLAEANEGRTSEWRRRMVSTLLFDPAAGIGSPVPFMRAKLAGGPGAHLELKWAIGRLAKAKGRHHTSAAFFEQVYAESGRDERYARAYVEGLVRVRRRDEARELLTSEATDGGRTAQWRMRALAGILAADAKWKDAADVFADQAFERHPRARAALKRELIAHSVATGNHALLARLYEDAFHAGGRPTDLVRPYIGALLKTRQYTKASSELASAVSAGYHTPWAFRSMASICEKLGRKDARALRALASEIELFPRDVDPRINLAKYYEKTGGRPSALAQYIEAARVRPERRDLYPRIVELASALGRIDLAREALAESLTRLPDPERAWGPELEGLVRLARSYPALGRGPGGAALSRLIGRHLQAELAIVMTWDTERTDIDLHVTEPGGEECSYRQKRSPGGGRLDRDDTDGLGPETYSVRRAKSGHYRVDVVYYDGVRRTMVTVSIYRNRGGEDETVTTQEVELTKPKQRVTVARVEIPRAK